MQQVCLNEGFTVFHEDEHTVLLYRHTDPVDAETEETMLRVILSRFHHTTVPRTVLDLSDVMNRHIARLTEEHCSSLRFHDPFLDELKQLQTRTLLQK